MNDEIGKVVARTGRGEPFSVEASAKPWCADTTTVDADDEERTRLDAEHAEQMEALRTQLRKPITAGYFSELARGGHGPSSVIEKFFGDGEAE
jgi:hypothetical protein